jgi:nucleoside-diphosphate-sugar epimerase
VSSESSNSRIVIAGAGGVIGRRLCHLLVSDGWQVTGTTRSPEKASALIAIGVTPIIVDVFDEERLRAVVAEARPAIVVHQLTDLPPGLDPAKMAEARLRNARLREIGTRNLIVAAVAGGARRMVAQSVAFCYTPGPMPYREEWPLHVEAPDDAGGLTARAVASLERQVLTAPFVGIVLRYGKFYGPETGFDVPPTGGPVHVDAAADAARRAVTRGAAGVYNVAEEDGTVSSRKAMSELGWSPAFRIAEANRDDAGEERVR